MNTETTIRTALSDYADEVTIGLSAATVRSRATRIRRRRRVAAATALMAVAAVVTVVSLVVPGASSTRAPIASLPTKHYSTDNQAVRQWQRSIASYVGNLTTVLRAQPNHTGHTLDNGLHALVVYGVGQPPPALQREIDAAPPQVSVIWQSVPSTRRQINTAMREISNSNYPMLSSWWPDNSFRGLAVTVHLDGHTTLAEARAALQGFVTNGVAIVSCTRGPVGHFDGGGASGR